MQRGTCPFVQKYQNAQDAGAVAALIFNDGFEGRTDPLFITAPTTTTIPAAMVSYEVGTALASAGATARIVVDATTTPNDELNVIADSVKGDKDRTIVVGAHLDSVEAGPGINDNASGTSGFSRSPSRSPSCRASRATGCASPSGAPRRPARGLDRLRGRAGGERRHRSDRSEPELRHDRLAELRPLRVRR